MEEASLMGFSGGFEQGKPSTALPELDPFIAANASRVNSESAAKRHCRLNFERVENHDDTHSIATLVSQPNLRNCPFTSKSHVRRREAGSLEPFAND